MKLQLLLPSQNSLHKAGLRHNTIISKSVPRLLPIFLFICLALAAGHAATDTWQGNTSVNWGDANWIGGNNPPISGDALVFGVAGTAGATLNNNLTAGTLIDGITFSSAASAYTLSGNGILLSGQINNAMQSPGNGITNNSGNTETIALPLTLDWGTYTFGDGAGGTGNLAINDGLTANSGGVALFGGAGSGSVTTSGGSALTVDATGLITGLDGAALIETSTAGNIATLPLATVSGGVVVALGSSSYVSVASGAISSSSNILLTGNAAYTSANGTQVDNIVAANTTSEALTQTGTLTLGAGSSGIGGIYVTRSTTAQLFEITTGTLTAGTTSAGGEIILGINGNAGNTSNEMEMNSTIVNNAAGGLVHVVKTGLGSVYFNTTSNYSGGTYVEEGQLQLNNSGAVGTGPIYVAGGATLYPNGSGTYVNNLFLSPGTGNNLDTANNGSIFLGNGANKVTLSGTLTLQGAPATSAPGDRITVKTNNSGLASTLSGQITGPGTLDINGQDSTATIILDDLNGNANNWTGGTILENDASTSDSLDVQLGANNQFGAIGGTSAGNVTFFDTNSGPSGTVTLDMHGFSDTIGSLIGAVGTDAFVNNTVGTAATLTIGDNSSSGVFGGIIENTGGGALSIVKTGTGTQTFSGANTFTGTTTVNAGIINYENGTAFGADSAIGIATGSNATIQVQGGITGGSQPMTISGTGAPNATGALENVSGNNSYAGAITLGANTTISSDAGNLTLAGAIGDGGNGYALTTTGTGAVTLTGASTYTGATTVQNGTLRIGGNGSVNSPGGITVNGAGARFAADSSVEVPTVNLTQGIVDGTSSISEVTVADAAGNIVQNGDGGTAPLTIGQLTFNGAGAININDSNVPTIAGLNISLLTTGASNQSGIVTINAADSSGWTNGSTYDLVNFEFLLADGVAANDNIVEGTISGTNARQDAVMAVTGSDITLTITGDSPKWTGSDNGNWQVGSTGSHDNWVLINAQTPTNYIQGDSVLFDDTATRGSVSISSGNVSPTFTTFNNNALNYTLTSGSGFGIAGSGALLKSGTGTLTIETPNSYTGATTISAGVVNYQNGSAFGVSSAITVASGATAQAQGNITGGSQALSIAGAGAANATGALENVSGSNSYAGAITLGSNTTISSDSGNLTLSGAIGDGGNGYTLTTTGTGTITLSGANSFTGTTTIGEGIVNYQNATAFSTNSAITVSSGATAQVQGGITSGGLTLNIAGAGALNATGALENVSGTNFLASSVSLNGASTISADAGALTLTNGIAGTGDLTLYNNSTSAEGITICRQPQRDRGHLRFRHGILDVDCRNHRIKRDEPHPKRHGHAVNQQYRQRVHRKYRR